MSDPANELRALRRELETLLAQVHRLAGRIDAAEKRAAADARTAQSAALIPPSAPTPSIQMPRMSSPEPVQAIESVSADQPTGTKPPPLPPPLPDARQVKKSPEPAAPKVSWEVALGTYWLPRIAGFVIATGVVLFLSLAMQRLGPPARVGIGYGIGAILLFLGWHWERRYQAYARILLSIGFALTYIVTYAAHYIEFARVIHTPQVSWAVLAAVVAAWAGTAQYRRSRVMATFVTVLAHFTVFLTGPGRMSVVALVIISAGSAFFLWRNRWYVVAILGVVGAYLNHFLWMWHNRGEGYPVDFALCMFFVASYFFIFALAELAIPGEARLRAIPLRYRTLFATLNSAGALGLALVTVQSFDFARPHIDLTWFSAAAIFLILGLACLRLRGKDPLYNLYVTKAVSAATFGLAVRYSGEALTVSLAVETAVLLVSARRSGLGVTRILGVAVGILTAIHGLVLLQGGQPDSTEGLLLQGGICVAALVIAALLYEKTNWARLAPPSLKIPQALLPLAWDLDLIRERPLGVGGHDDRNRSWPAAYILAAAAAFVFAVFAYLRFDTADIFTALAVGALAFVLVSAAAVAKAPGCFGVGLAALAAFMATHSAVTDDVSRPWASVLGVLAVAGVAIASETRWKNLFPALAPLRVFPVPELLYAFAAWSALLTLLAHLQDPRATFVAALLALGCTAATGMLRPSALLVAAFIFSGVGALATSDHAAGGFLWHASFWLLAFAVFVGDTWFRASIAPARWTAVLRGAWIVCPWLVFVAYYLPEVASAHWRGLWWTAAAFFLLGYGLAARNYVALVLSLITQIVASAMLVSVSLADGLPLWPLLSRYAAAVAYWIAIERCCTQFSRRLDGTSAKQARQVAGAPVAVATVMALCMFTAIPNVAETGIAIYWAVLALGFYGLSLLFHQRYYRYAGLAVLAVTLLRVTVSVILSDMDTLLKVLAALVLGTVMLSVSFGYYKAQERLRTNGGSHTGDA